MCSVLITDAVFVTAHLSWVAPTLRRCYEMVDPSRLEIELFVSRDAPRPSRRARKAQEDLAYPTTPVDEFAPPMAPFARENGRKDSFSRDSMDDSDVSDVEDDSTTRQERSRSSFPPREYEDHVDSVTDLVLFDGEDDIRTPKELDVSTRVRKEGKLRRALSRCKTIRAVDPPSNSASSPSQPLRPDSSYSHVNLNADHEYGATDQQHYSSNRPSEDHSQSPYSYARPDLTSYNSTRGSFTEVGITNYSPSRQTFNPVEHDAQSDVYSFTGNSSIRHLVPGAASHAGRRDDPSTASLANEGIGGPAVTPDAEDYLDLPEADQVDLDVVAELAKTGYPNLGQVMDDEVQRSSGKLMVACESLLFLLSVLLLSCRQVPSFSPSPRLRLSAGIPCFGAGPRQDPYPCARGPQCDHGQPLFPLFHHFLHSFVVATLGRAVKCLNLRHLSSTGPKELCLASTSCKAYTSPI